jgi:hypothetical protein
MNKNRGNKTALHPQSSLKIINKFKIKIEASHWTALPC